MCCMPVWFSIVYMSITAWVKGQSLTEWDLCTPFNGWYAWRAFPTSAWFPSLTTFINEWSGSAPAALRSAICFDALGLFINAVTHFLRLLSFQVSSLQDHILGNIFSCRSTVAFHLYWGWHILLLFLQVNTVPWCLNEMLLTSFCRKDWRMEHGTTAVSQRCSESSWWAAVSRLYLLRPQSVFALPVSSAGGRYEDGFT